jgi:hypothetical protein
MARPKKSSVLDFRILCLAAFILASLVAIGVRLAAQSFKQAVGEGAVPAVPQESRAQRAVLDHGGRDRPASVRDRPSRTIARANIRRTCAPSEHRPQRPRSASAVCSVRVMSRGAPI